MRFKLLFVDDEVNVLNGIRRSMRSMRENWECDYANSGHEAIEFLNKEHYDVIISDIRMPEMGGVELLNYAKDRHPDIIRLALSGHAETETELECVRAAHQFLAKPIAVDELKSAIESAFNLKKFVANNTQIISLLGGIDSLPSVPGMYQQIVEEAAKADGSIDRIGEIITSDLAMSVKILQLVNSSFFGLKTEIKSISHAASLLGLDIIKNLVFSQEIFRSYKSKIANTQVLTQIVEHCNQTGILTKFISEKIGLSKSAADQGVMAGTVHEIGKLILLNSFEKEYTEILVKANQDSYRLLAQESELLGITHDKVGAYLLGIWGLPVSIVEAVAYHYQPSECPNKTKSILTSLYIANSIIEADEKSLSAENFSEQLQLEYLSEISSIEEIEAAYANYQKFKDTGNRTEAAP